MTIFGNIITLHMNRVKFFTMIDLSFKYNIIQKYNDVSIKID